MPQQFDAAQAMSHARLGGWNVRLVGLQTAPVLDENGVTPPLPVPDRYATVRTNPVTGAADVLGVVGPAYTVIQHEPHADLLHTLVDESGAHVATAGSLRGGPAVVLSLKLPTPIQVGRIDPLAADLVRPQHRHATTRGSSCETSGGRRSHRGGVSVCAPRSPARARGR